MRLLQKVLSWWKSRQPKKLADLLAVEWDEETVRVRVLERMDPAWNKEFRWADVTRVCFKDEGLYASDILYVEVHGRERPVVVLTEARGGDAFFGELARRGLFPQPLMDAAIRSIDGGLYCWPPMEQQRG